MLTPRPIRLKPARYELRQVETRGFDTRDERKVLQASASVLQDLGYTISESDSKTGLLAASKIRDARDAGQMAASFSMAIVSALATGQGQTSEYDVEQRIAAMLVVAPSGKKVKVRATFRRAISTNSGRIRYEDVKDPEVYQEFFNKLGQSLYLAAEGI